MNQELKLYPRWKQAVQDLLLAGLTYGSRVEKSQLIDLCGLQLPTTIEEKDKFDLQLLNCISEIKDELLTQHRMLLATNNDGSYRVVRPEDQTAYVIDKGARALAKELQRMATGVQFVNADLLTDEQRKRNADAQAKVGLLAGMQRAGMREVQAAIE